VFAFDEGRTDNLPFEEVLARVPHELKEEWDNCQKALERVTGRPVMKR
jgi:hypothetical protein